MKNKKRFRQLLEDNNFDELLKDMDSSLITSNSLLDARIRKGVSQAELASLVGMQQSAIARLENPGYTVKYLRTLEKLAIALDADFIPPQLVEGGASGQSKELGSSIFFNLTPHDSLNKGRVVLQNSTQSTISFNL